MLRDAYLLCDLFVFPPFDLFLAWQYDIVSTSTWIFILKHIGQHLSGFTPQQAIFHLSGKCYVLCANLQKMPLLCLKFAFSKSQNHGKFPLVLMYCHPAALGRDISSRFVKHKAFHLAKDILHKWLIIFRSIN